MHPSKHASAERASAENPSDDASEVLPGHAPESPEPDDTTSRDPAARPVEIGGQKGLEPTRYGDWEKRGRCTDF